MIHDVDESLRELVRRDVLNGSNIEVSFDAPNRDWAGRRQGPTLNFYLYDITEDLERRQVQYEEVRNEQGRVVDRRMPPRKFRLSYLVTAWTQRPEDEHRLLSAVLGCFVRSDALPTEILKGALADRQEAVRVTIGLPLPKDRQLSDIWSALGGELKAALDLVVTAPFETGRELEIGPIVIEEPRITVAGPDGQAEEAHRRRRGAGEAEREPPAAEETVDGGKAGTGRRLRIRTLPEP